jgi:hypothetical protein
VVDVLTNTSTQYVQLASVTNGLDVRVSASFHRGGWEVRWRDASGRRRARIASERAAQDARRRLIEQVERGEVRHAKETFSLYWERCDFRSPRKRLPIEGWAVRPFAVLRERLDHLA